MTQVHQDTTAIATAPGGGVGIIRVSGEKAGGCMRHSGL